MGDEAGEPRGTQYSGLGHGCSIARDGVLGQGKSGWWPALQQGPGPRERGADGSWPWDVRNLTGCCAWHRDHGTPGGAATNLNQASSYLISVSKSWAGDLHPHQTGAGSASCAHARHLGHPEPRQAQFPICPQGSWTISVTGES